MLAGLPLSKFYERMEKYGYVIDKTCLLEGTMLRLKITKQASEKPANKSIIHHNQDIKGPIVTNKSRANVQRSNNIFDQKESNQI
jgi:hypothetical protein